eukprot:1152050-Rhodomonas_salina.4
MTDDANAYRAGLLHLSAKCLSQDAGVKWTGVARNAVPVAQNAALVSSVRVINESKVTAEHLLAKVLIVIYKGGIVLSWDVHLKGCY